MNKIEARSEFAIKKYILARIQLLAWMAGRLQGIKDSLPQQYSAVSAVFDLEWFLAQIDKLDAEYANKESALFAEYQPLIHKYYKPNLLNVKNDLELAIAEVKNKINIAVTAVKTSASHLMNTPQATSIEGAQKARLEYLSTLTLQKQIAEFDEIIKQMM